MVFAHWAAWLLQFKTAMKQDLTQCLFALQERHFQRRAPSSDSESNVRALRAKIPKSVLEQFDRSLERGRKPVAIVRNGVCGECHLKLPTGVLAALAFEQTIQQCANCGRYLHLQEDEPVFAMPAAVVTKRAPRKREASTHAS